MERPWLASYPPGMPQHIADDEFPSLTALLEQSARRYSKRPAFVSFGHYLSYGEVDELSASFAAFLQSRGLERGARIGLMMPNLLQYPIAAFGALRAGLVVVNINPQYTVRELRAQLRDAELTAVVVLDMLGAGLREVLQDTPIKTVVVTALGDLLPLPKAWALGAALKISKGWRGPPVISGAIAWRSALSQGHRREFRAIARCRQDPAFLQYTGGTTGVSKGAILSHGNLLANIAQITPWIRYPWSEGKGLNECEEVILTALPLYHIFALTANWLVFFALGALNVLVTDPRDLTGLVRTLRRYPVTCMTGVNTLFAGLLRTLDFEKLDFSCFKMTLGGGMAVQSTVADEWQMVTGTALTEAYGLTEASPAVCINPLDGGQGDGGIGYPLPSTDCEIRNEAGHGLALGETGELWLRGPQVMPGYWRRPAESAVVLKDGWLRTGDLGTMDAKGRIHLKDRLKDMVLVSGFNVYPNEIEAVLASHPVVVEVGVVGIPDAKSGQCVKAVVVADDSELSSAELEAWCRQNLAAYKVPKVIEFRASLPKSTVGKILRRELR